MQYNGPMNFTFQFLTHAAGENINRVLEPASEYRVEIMAWVSDPQTGQNMIEWFEQNPSGIQWFGEQR